MADYVFLDPGADVTRRDVYRRGRELGMRVVLVSRRVSWETDQIDDWIEADPTDPAQVLSRTAGLRVAGVVNCSESCLEAAALLAREHGVPGVSPEVAALCRDKIAMGNRLRAAEVPMARRYVLGDAREAGAAVHQVGVPGVLKPSTGVASLYTVRFDSEADLRARLDRFGEMITARVPAPLRGMRGRWVVEEYLDGPAFSVESVVSGSTPAHVAVCAKGDTEGPFFREVGHSTPPGLAPDVLAELFDLTGRAIGALGIEDCVTHTEFKVTAAGPRMLEIAARMGGGSIRQVVLAATGTDLLEATLRFAMGQRPEATPSQRGAAASRSWYPDRAGRLRRMDAEALARLPGIVAVNRWMAEGELYELPPDGYREVCGVVATGTSAGAAVRLAESALEIARDHELVVLDPVGSPARTGGNGRLR
ncbi:ATP-grasp domain-containing protein [Amycolatopsis anabasis]|uniref:ATP-grasp domain-containing protein n=1 Tax=Amycolatopsis anabasis TaxID=1840409 RepID=UPI00131B040D|nr:ATP-grasp domain-containing protein [Amycolatopsis anabasis]